MFLQLVTDMISYLLHNFTERNKVMDRAMICIFKLTTEVVTGLKVRSVILKLAVLKRTCINGIAGLKDF